MPHGAPDDSNVVKQTTLYRTDDMAELAARLGSPFTYRRVGGIEGWQSLIMGVGGLVTASNEAVYMGKVACRLYSGTGATPYANISKYFPPVQLQKVGLQCSFSLDTNIRRLTWQFAYYDGDDVHWSSITYAHPGGVWSYTNEGEVPTVFEPSFPLYDLTGVTHHVKIVCDLTSYRYVGVHIDNRFYSLAGEGMPQGVMPGSPYMNVILAAWGSAATAGTEWLDNVVLTMNEV